MFAFLAAYQSCLRGAPLAAMARGVVENVLAPHKLDALFERTAQRQYTRELAFSQVVELMTAVAARTAQSVRAAYQNRAGELSVGVRTVYHKLERLEPALSRALVRQTAADMKRVIDQWSGSRPPQSLPYCVKIIDGNHLSATHRRLGPLRGQAAAALPGRSVAVLEPQYGLISDVFPLEDGHASERRALPELLQTVRRHDLIVADRNFCVRHFAWGIRRRKAFFLFRRHKSNLPLELVGERKFVGNSPRGKVYEQTALLKRKDGRSLQLRLISVELKTPTRDGDQVLELVTNLPARRVTALAAAELYLSRWSIEDAFYELTMELRCEVCALGYPRAALFSFCAAVVCYNVLGVIQAALESRFGAARIQAELSSYYVADELGRAWWGLELAVPAEQWRSDFAPWSAAELAQALGEMAGQVNLSRYRKAPTRPRAGPKKRPPRRLKSHHVSTAKIIAGK